MEYKVIREDKYGVLVTINNKIPMCRNCKYYEQEPTNSPCYADEDGILCDGGRYLTEEEEKEYYSSNKQTK